MDSKMLRELGDKYFSKRGALLSLWQEQAENFYPQRADFTIRRWLGSDFAGNLTTSYPMLCQRDLSEQLTTMLRNTAKDWFHMKPKNVKLKDNDTLRWLEWANDTMKRAMYDRPARFTIATKEGDNDFVTFGQAVISVELNRYGDGLLYRCWHLRDMAWMEDEDGKICAIWRRWKPSARDLKRLFAKVSPQVDQILQRNEPFTEVECMHMMVAGELAEENAKGKPWVSIYYDCQHEFEMEAVGVWTKKYVIPRWQTVSGSQYAFSPATVAALPEARLLQAMTYTLLEAGEKITNPPMVATMEAVRSDVAIYAGGITWVDMEYDERLGDALRPLTQDGRGMPIGIEMQKDSRAMLMQAFYLDKLRLPQQRPQMTAYEVSQYVEQYIRGALPLFEPMEEEYNGGLCDETFELLLRNGGFGSVLDMPKPLRGPSGMPNIEFGFVSPLHDAIDEQKGQLLLQGKALIADAYALDKTVLNIPDVKMALRDALNGIGWSPQWMRSEAEVDEMAAQQQEAEQQQDTLANMQTGSETAANLAGAQKDMADAGAPLPVTA